MGITNLTTKFTKAIPLTTDIRISIAITSSNLAMVQEIRAQIWALAVGSAGRELRGCLRQANRASFPILSFSEIDNIILLVIIEAYVSWKFIVSFEFRSSNIS